MMLLAINLLGMGLGPLLVGVFSDMFIATGNESVRYGLAVVVSLSLVGAIAYALGAKPYASAITSKIT